MTIDLTDLARKGLQAELARLDSERARIAGLLAQLGKASRTPAATTSNATPRARKMSPEGRQRIQEAVRRRWERVRAAQTAAGGQAEKNSGTAAATANASGE